MRKQHALFPWTGWRHLAHVNGIDAAGFWSMTPAELHACLLGGHDDGNTHRVGLTRPQLDKLMQAYPDSYRNDNDR